MTRKVQLLAGNDAELSRIQGPGVVRAAPGHRSRGRLATQSLPVLLAGPICRSLSPRSMKIWVAMSVPCGVRLTVYASPGGRFSEARDQWTIVAKNYAAASNTPQDESAPQNDLLQIGANLYVCVVEARGRMSASTIYAYDIELVAPPGMSFNNGNGAAHTRELVYAPFPLPTVFMNRPASRQLNVLQASCRKMHGPGNDATLDADRHVRSHATQLDQRPAIIVFTGDQIYADDVEPSGFGEGIGHAGELLMGFHEIMSDRTQDVPRAARDRYPRQLRWQDRQNVLLDPAVGFTFDRGIRPYHLMSLGEFCATYIFAWATPLWLHDPLRSTMAQFFGSVRTSIEAMRRLMANAPTFMIADDHETTDDLPIHESNWNIVRHNRVGRWVVSNARTAFWAFQLKGVGPTRAGSVIESSLTEYRTAGLAFGLHGADPPPGEASRNQGASAATMQTGAAPARRVTRERLHTARDNYSWRVASYAGGFTYATRSYPPIIMLDTRWQRSLSSGHPALLGPTAMQQLSQIVGTLRRRLPDVPLLMVSPGPVLGSQTLEWIQSVHPSDALDPEAWSLNEACFAEFLDVLAGHGHHEAIIMSGDVHYGFAAHGDWGSPHRHADLRVIQLTSSSLKNRVPDGAKRNALNTLDGLIARGAGTATKGFTSPSGRDHGGIMSPGARQLTTQFYSSTGDNRILYLDNNAGLVHVDWRHSLRVTQQLIGPGGAGPVVRISGLPQPTSEPGRGTTMPRAGPATSGGEAP